MTAFWFAQMAVDIQPNTGLPIISTPGSTPGSTPVPLVPVPEPTDPNDNGGHDGGTVLDLSAHESLAAAIVGQYLTFDRQESTTARSARLAPYVQDDSAILTQIPSVAAEELWDRSSFNAVVTVISIDLTAVSGIDEAAGTVTITVVTTYRAVYTQPGQEQVEVDRREWNIIVPIEKPLLALEIIDP